MARFGVGTKISAFVEGGYHVKYASYNTDNADNTGGVAGFKSYGTFEHDIQRIGGGIKIPLNKYSNEMDAYLELAYFKDNLTPLDWANFTPQTITKPNSKADVYKLTFVYGVLFLNGEYSPMYPTGGSALFKVSDANKSTGIYYTVRLGLIIDL
jgi:hypothetical protein